MLLTAGGVPRDVAVDQPDARVIGAHGDGDVALLREEDDVTPRRVVKVEMSEALLGVKGGLVLCQNQDVVAVPVDRVGYCSKGDGGVSFWYWGRTGSNSSSLGGGRTEEPLTWDDCNVVRSRGVRVRFHDHIYVTSVVRLCFRRDKSAVSRHSQTVDSDEPGGNSHTVQHV